MSIELYNKMATTMRISDELWGRLHSLRKRGESLEGVLRQLLKMKPLIKKKRGTKNE